MTRGHMKSGMVSSIIEQYEASLCAMEIQKIEWQLQAYEYILYRDDWTPDEVAARDAAKVRLMYLKQNS